MKYDTLIITRNKTTYYLIGVLFTMLLVGTCFTTRVFAAPTEPVAVLPSTRWVTECKPGDTATLTEDNGCLRIRFDVDVHDYHQVGHQAMKQATVNLFLTHPLPLTPAQTRICFEAWGMVMEGTSSIQLTPIIRDEHGELLVYNPYPYPHLNAGSAHWSKWSSRYLYTSEAGGATQDVFEAEGGDGNSWPDGKLTFLGFRIQVRKEAFGRQQGDLALGSIELADLKIPSEYPFVYTDSLLKEKGNYRLATRISNEFQGKSIRESVTPITFDPQNLQSCKQRITFQLGADDNYWITYQITDAAGKVVAGKDMRYQIEGSGIHTPAPTVDQQSEPSLGYLRINPDAHTNGVYTQNEPFVVTARVFPKDAQTLTLSWKLIQYGLPTLVEQGTQAVDFNGAAYKDIPIRLTGESGRDAYRLQLTVQNGTQTVDTQEYLLGKQTDFGKPYAPITGRIADRDYVKKSAYFRLTYLQPDNGVIKTEDDAVKSFVAFLDEGSQMTRYITYMIDPAELEILPGVYDFHLLDRIIDAAAERGCALTIRIAHADGIMLYRWLKYSAQFSFDGAPIAGPSYYGGYALTNDPFKQCWFNAYAALYKRYKTHPGFQGYYLMQAAGEWAVLDEPWMGNMAGYEQSTLPAFRDYLQTTLKLSLAQLNTRWGTQYPSWDEVRPPMPNLTIGKMPDLRMSWLDFMVFKAALDDSWFQQTAKGIREYDPNHIIIAYTGNPNGLVGLADYLHNGGNHFLKDEGKLMSAWDGGLGWITEPHHPHRWAAYGDPAGMGWVLDWSVYIMMAQAGAGGTNLHVYYMDNPSVLLPAHYGGAFAYDRFEMFKPILRELHSVKIVEPVKEVAVLQDPYTLYCKHRTMFAAREEDLKQWFSLLKLDAVDYEDLRPGKASQYKLLLPNILDEVMSAKNIVSLNQLVRNGTHMIICANTGKYSPEYGEAPFQLLKQLGITPPTGAYVQDETSVMAQTITQSPLFANDTPIKFYTQAEMKKEMQSKEIRDNFMNWPYRWIPETDYFGYYKENMTTNGQVLARFASGGVALSLHKVGNGEVLVFWGTPDYTPALLKGLMARAASWAGVSTSRQGSPIPYTLEGLSEELGRHYALMYQEQLGNYQQRLPLTPDGTWFLDDIVSGARLGTYTGKELREQGLPVTYLQGFSPLKIIRMIPVAQMQADWLGKYRQPAP